MTKLLFFTISLASSTMFEILYGDTSDDLAPYMCGFFTKPPINNILNAFLSSHFVGSGRMFESFLRRIIEFSANSLVI